MTSLLATAQTRRHLWLLLVALCLLPGTARGEETNRLLRIKVRPHHGFTRVELFFQAPPDYQLTRGSDRVRLLVRQADAPGFKRLRGYRDPNLGGIICSSRQDHLQLTVPTRQPDTGVTLVDFVAPTVLTLDIGPSLKRPNRVDVLPGREPILSGVEQFVRDYSTPAPAALPFTPTDTKTLKRLLPEQEVKLFELAEGALYKEKAGDALKLLANFEGKSPQVRALAGFRSAQALLFLERYDEARKAYDAAAALWPEYPGQSPELLQTLADLKAKTGDYQGARRLLGDLVGRMAGTAYIPQLVNRLAELSARHGNAPQARTLYRTVAAHAAGTPPAQRARMKLVDGELFSISRDRYQDLADRYQQIYSSPCDFPLRDEALYKLALVEGLYGPARTGLATAIEYQQRYPRGIFSTIVKKMREELLVPALGESWSGRRYQELVQLAMDNKEYLTRCFADPQFAPRLAQSCQKAGMLNQELALFGYLLERSWAGGSAPFMLGRLIDDALAVGNRPLAQASARSFLARYPSDPRSQGLHELLARMAFEQGDLKQVAAELAFLNQKGRSALSPESNYYLGKALVAGNDWPGAERALSRFCAAPPAGSNLLADSYLMLLNGRSALKQYPAALETCRAGLKVTGGENAALFRYKMGEIYLQLKMVREAKAAWEEVVKMKEAGTWAKLASESLADLGWRLKIAGELP